VAGRVLEREAVLGIDDARAQTQRGEWAREVGALFRRWYLQLIRDRLNLVFSLTQPAIWLAFFGSAMGRAIDPRVIGTSDYVGFMLAGVIAFTVVTNTVSGAMPLLWDKEVGYLDKLLAMPIARSSLIVSRFLFQFALGSAQVFLVFVVAVASSVNVASGSLGAIGILAVAGLLSMSFTALFMALAYRAPTHGTFFAVAGFITLPLVFLSNAFVPIEAMPAWMQVIARLNPLSYAIEAMRILVLEGWAVDVVRAAGVLLAFAVGSLALATFEFVRHTGERSS
jgi:ABC-2 type transport system permease protein